MVDALFCCGTEAVHDMFFLSFLQMFPAMLTFIKLCCLACITTTPFLRDLVSEIAPAPGCIGAEQKAIVV
jgi:hypothetical protein